MTWMPFGFADHMKVFNLLSINTYNFICRNKSKSEFLICPWCIMLTSCHFHIAPSYNHIQFYIIYAFVIMFHVHLIYCAYPLSCHLCYATCFMFLLLLLYTMLLYLTAQEGALQLPLFSVLQVAFTG